MAEAKKYSLEELITLKKKEKLHHLVKDISGQKFNRLTVLFPIEGTRKGVYWACECECGNYIITRGDGLKRGTTKSCGCWNTEVRRQQCNKRNLDKANEIFNQKFEFIIPIKLLGTNEQQQRLVECQCSCGNIFTTTVGHLKSGHTKSCGCKKNNLIVEALKKDLKGQRFGKLIAQKSVLLENGIWGWECLCDCGNSTIVRTDYLLSEHTKSCGCLASKGEYNINVLLQANDIQYEYQKTFDNCRYSNNYLVRFDFYIDNRYLLEFDGRQHYEGWSSSEDNLKIQQERDAYKNQWCKDNNIPLIRIPYTKLDTLCIEDLMLETTQFRVV